MCNRLKTWTTNFRWRPCHNRVVPRSSAIITYLLTYFLTPCSRVLLVKLTVFQLVKKFLAFYGTRRFITALTSARHLSLSWARSIQCMFPHPTSWRTTLILSSHLRLCLPSAVFPSGFPTTTSTLPYTCYMPRPFHSFDFITRKILGENGPITV